MSLNLNPFSEMQPIATSGRLQSFLLSIEQTEIAPAKAKDKWFADALIADGWTDSIRSQVEDARTITRFELMIAHNVGHIVVISNGVVLIKDGPVPTCYEQSASCIEDRIEPYNQPLPCGYSYAAWVEQNHDWEVVQ